MIRTSSAFAQAPRQAVRRRAGGPARMTQPAPSGWPLRAVSDDSRNVPRPPGAAPDLRAGSIRAAVTRYNEEHEANRVVPRPPGPSGRLPDPSLYRN
ncbi:hypothetical protein D7S89_11255 [Trinickia fusca]|uniref:Uncharacterized protein n=1 Tax=Trinickia fusca TaxID=2419777 RepID=A0A494XML7_9BURK|nr:hypothetical protein D7S89_11255 [Trinickia fusca]